HTAPIYSLAVSTDGRTAASGAQDNTLRTWQVPLSHPIRSFAGPAAPVESALSPDGRTLLTVHGDAMIRSWLTDVGQNLAPRAGTATELNQEPWKPVNAEPSGTWSIPEVPELGLSGSLRILKAAWRNDGLFFVSYDTGGHLLVWTPALPEPVGIISDVPGQVVRLLIPTSNQQIITAHHDGTVRVWQLSGIPSLSQATAQLVAAQQTPTPEVAEGDAAPAAHPWLRSTVSIFQPANADAQQNDVPPTTGELRDAVLLNGGSQIVTCHGTGQIFVTDVNNGNRIREFVTSGRIFSVAARVDNQRIAAGTDQNQVVVWNAAAPDKPLLILPLRAAVSTIRFSANNQYLAAGCADRSVTIFGRSAQGVNPVVELVAHQTFTATQDLQGVCLNADGTFVLVAQADGRTEEWAYASPEQIRQFNHGGAVYGVAISSSGQTIVSCSADQTLRVWNAMTGAQQFQLSGHQGAVHAVALSHDDSFVVSSGADGTLRMWDIVGGRQLKQLARFEQTMYSIALHPAGTILAAAGADRKVHLIEVSTGHELRTLEGHSDYIHSVIFSPGGEEVLSYGYAGNLRRWRTDNGQLISEHQIGRIGNTAQFSRDGGRILLSNGDGIARIYEPGKSN
ncbi:MAG: hypothetical protein KDA96_25750, partial [Planctomycetaceae bacterium]|nr:hypothetical protein [Planctomycetaceae bacterium]